MNTLAHLHLAGPDEDVLVGGFIADAVKGPELEPYPPGVRRGIRLHRRIDAFTDSHAIVRQTTARLRPRFHKYAPVVADLFYDHFLAADWRTYHVEELRSFAARMYRLLERRRTDLPPRSRVFLGYLEANDLLSRYAEPEGIGRAAEALARRTRFESGMEFAVEALTADYRLYADEFRAFYPDAREEAARFLGRGG